MSEKSLSIDEQIRMAERHLRELKRKKPLEIGKYVLKQCKVPSIKKDGNPKTDKNGNIVKRYLHNVHEFKTKFSIVQDSVIDIARFGEFVAKKKGLNNLNSMNDYVRRNGGNGIF